MTGGDPADLDPRAVARRAVPDREPASVTRIGRGNRKTTSVVEFADAPAVVVQTAADVAALRSEAALTAAIDGATGIPVPSVLAGGVADGGAYLVTERVAGRNLHEPFADLPAERRTAIARAFGRYLAELHAAATFDAYGDLRPAGDRWLADEWPTTAEPGSLAVREAAAPSDWLEGYGRDALDRLPAEFDPVAEEIERRLAARVGGDGEPAGDAGADAVLFPWDLRPGNALVADGGIAAVLDWEAPLAAPPALAAAKVEYLVVDWYLEEPAAERAAFRAGYEAVRPYPEVDPLFRALAIADTAVDSTGTVTNPLYPELDRAAAVAFHREALDRAL